MRRSEFNTLPLLLPPPLVPVPHITWVSEALGQQPCSRLGKVFSICENKCCSEPRAVPSDRQRAQNRQQMLVFFVNPKPNYALSSPTGLGGGKKKKPNLIYGFQSSLLGFKAAEYVFQWCFLSSTSGKQAGALPEQEWYCVWCLPTPGLHIGALHVTSGKLNSHWGMKRGTWRLADMQVWTQQLHLVSA